MFTPGLAGLVLGEFRRLAAEPQRKDGRDNRVELVRFAIAKSLDTLGR